MSLAELLPAIRALPRTEQVKLMHLLVDELGGNQSDEIPPRLREVLPPGGATVATGWQVTTDAEGMEAIAGLLRAGRTEP